MDRLPLQFVSRALASVMSIGSLRSRGGCGGAANNGICLRLLQFRACCAWRRVGAAAQCDECCLGFQLQILRSGGPIRIRIFQTQGARGFAKENSG